MGQKCGTKERLINTKFTNDVDKSQVQGTRSSTRQAHFMTSELLHNNFFFL